ncbi:hypothetical protein JB92DRAFT_972356 [Gautieria morchelliformis]|nr:hypothetical protein JB92DRAFT_972356 [Gautieria morchelliformis]
MAREIQAPVALVLPSTRIAQPPSPTCRYQPVSHKYLRIIHARHTTGTITHQSRVSKRRAGNKKRKRKRKTAREQNPTLVTTHTHELATARDTRTPSLKPPEAAPRIPPRAHPHRARLPPPPLRLPFPPPPPPRLPLLVAPLLPRHGMRQKLPFPLRHRHPLSRIRARRSAQDMPVRLLRLGRRDAVVRHERGQREQQLVHVHQAPLRLVPIVHVDVVPVRVPIPVSAAAQQRAGLVRAPGTPARGERARVGRDDERAAVVRLLRVRREDRAQRGRGGEVDVRVRVRVRVRV